MPGNSYEGSVVFVSYNFITYNKRSFEYTHDRGHILIFIISKTYIFLLPLHNMLIKNTRAYFIRETSVKRPQK